MNVIYVLAKNYSFAMMLMKTRKEDSVARTDWMKWSSERCVVQHDFMQNIMPVLRATCRVS